MVLALSGASVLSAAAQLSLSSTSPTLSENFDSMWTPSMQNVITKNVSLPEGWKIDVNASGPRQVKAWEECSSVVDYTDSEDLASNQANGSYCWGDTRNVGDRAIGGLTTGSVSNTDGKARGINVLTKIQNSDPSKILTNVNLSYNIEKYRDGNNSSGFSVRVYTSSDGVKWTEAENMIESFDPDSQTLGASSVPISTTPKNGTVRVHVEPGQELYIAWNISVTAGGTCSGAPGYAVDDIVIEGVFADSDDWEEPEQPEFNPSGIYLRGELNGWEADSDWEFSKVSDTEFVLYNKTLSGAFKVADAAWSPSCNYGSNGSGITMGEPYLLVSGTDTNISCGSLSFPCSEIRLTIENGTATLLLSPNTSTQGLTAVYMVGDFNAWNYMGTTGKLTLDTADNLFKGQVALTAGPDGLSRWMIYQRLALAGAWGLPEDATGPSESGTLVSGQKGYVASEVGLYDVAFNLSTGEYTLSLLPSTPSGITVSPETVTLVPSLPEKVKILSMNNSLIHYNDQAKVFNDIAASIGKDAVWTKHTNLGKTLDYHWQEGDGMTDAGEPGAKMMVRSDAWSHIILQEQTALPRTDFNSFRASVGKWVEYIRQYCPNPNAVIILPLNWALGQDWSNFADYNKILVENYNKVAQEFGVVICPVGLAYQSKFEKDGGAATEASWFLPGDDRHPTLKATYMAALMEYGLIFNEDPTTVSYYPNYKTNEDAVGEMSDAIAAEMRQYASNALGAYNNVVDNHGGAVGFKATVLDQYGLEMPGESVEWSVTPEGASVVDGRFVATQNGEYTVTAVSSDFSASALVKVTEAETQVPQIDFIELGDDNLEYTQDFDSMGDGDDVAPIPEGWRADGQLTERTLGAYQTASTTTLKSSHGENFGSTAKNGVWNFGNSADLSDRALGGATTDTSGGAKSINIYTAFKNTGSKAISSLDIAYNVEKYRGGSNPAGFTVQLYTSVDGRTWKSAGSDFATSFTPDAATAGADVTPMETRGVSATLDLDMVPGTELFLAWNISATSGSSCMSAPLLSIDDFSVNANLKPVPVFDHYIYIENNSGYEKTGLYAWSNSSTPSEIFGAWPGQNPIDKVIIDGRTFEVFGHNQPSGNYSLIYNNNNNGSQYNDFAIEGGKDYYLTAKSDGKTLEAIEVETGIVEMPVADTPAILFDGLTVTCPEASAIRVYNSLGALSRRASGSVLSLEGLSRGVYLVSAGTPFGAVSRKILLR